MVRQHGKLLKLSLREIASHWFQYLSMVVIIGLAVTLFSGFVSNKITLEKRVNELFDEANIWDLNVYTTKLTSSDITFFQGLDNVTTETRFYADGMIDSQHAYFYLGDNTISVPVLKEGSMGVVIDSLFAEDNGYKIGDTINVELIDYDISFSLTITGFMRFAENVSSRTLCPIYVTLSDNPSLSPLLQNFANQMLIKTDDISGVKDQISSHFESSSNLLFTYDKDTMHSYALLNNEVKQSESMIYVFPVIFLFVSILVILTTISQLILRERTNIGTLKALGYKNRSIALHYSSVSIIVSVFGAIIGTIVGPMIIPDVMGIKYELIYNLPQASTEYSLLWSILAVLAVGLMSTGISLLISMEVLKENPAQCMRPKINRNLLLEKLIGGEVDE